MFRRTFFAVLLTFLVDFSGVANAVRTSWVAMVDRQGLSQFSPVTVTAGMNVRCLKLQYWSGSWAFDRNSAAYPNLFLLAIKFSTGANDVWRCGQVSSCQLERSFAPSVTMRLMSADSQIDTNPGTLVVSFYLSKKPCAQANLPLTQTVAISETRSMNASTATASLSSSVALAGTPSYSLTESAVVVSTSHTLRRSATASGSTTIAGSISSSQPRMLSPVELLPQVPPSVAIAAQTAAVLSGLVTTSTVNKASNSARVADLVTRCNEGALDESPPDPLMYLGVVPVGGPAASGIALWTGAGLLTSASVVAATAAAAVALWHGGHRPATTATDAGGTPGTIEGLAEVQSLRRAAPAEGQRLTKAARWIALLHVVVLSVYGPNVVEAAAHVVVSAVSTPLQRTAAAFSGLSAVACWLPTLLFLSLGWPRAAIRHRFGDGLRPIWTGCRDTSFIAVRLSFAEDVAVAMLMALFAGLRALQGCSATVWLMTAVAVLHLLYIAALRVYRSRLELGCAAAVAGLQLAQCSCAIASRSGRADASLPLRLGDAVYWAVIAQAVALTVAEVVSILQRHRHHQQPPAQPKSSPASQALEVPLVAPSSDFCASPTARAANPLQAL